jgi:hypothetical protein
MPNRHISTDYNRIPSIHMHDSAILNIRAIPDNDRVLIGSQDAIEPNTGTST